MTHSDLKECENKLSLTFVWIVCPSCLNIFQHGVYRCVCLDTIKAVFLQGWNCVALPRLPCVLHVYLFLPLPCLDVMGLVLQQSAEASNFFNGYTNIR